MSGGSYDYAFHRVNDMAHQLAASPDVTRRAFAAHLLLVAEAMHDVEWVDSCDYAPGDEYDSIQAVIGAAEVDQAARDLAIQTARSVLAAYGIDSQEGADG